MELSAALRRTAAELGLAATVSVGSRTTRLRTLLTAFGVGLGVVVLLVAASVPHAYAARRDREVAATPYFASSQYGRLHLLQDETVFRGVTIAESGVQVTAGPGAVPLPPGVAALPGPGRMIVSPAVRRMLDGPGGVELRRRLRARVVGVVGPAGLAEPDSAVVYRGSDAIVAEGVGTGTVRRFGVSSDVADVPLITVLVIVIVVALLLPVAVFVATAARFGSEQRDRRLAAMRLLGADRAMTVRIAAGESLIGALAGLCLGAAAFVALAPALARAGIGGITVFASDLRPAPPLAVLVGVLVPLCAIVATLVSIRRVAVEPLGVSVRRTTRRRRLAWRLALPALGFALLAPLVGSITAIDSTWGEAEATAGVMLVLVGVSALLPWAVETVVRRAPDGPLPWLLAIRRLRQEEGTTGRVIGAVGLAVAGAVALSVVFGAAESHVRTDAAHDGPPALSVVLSAPSQAAARRDLAMLRGLPGVRSAEQPSVSGHRRATLGVNLVLSDPAAGARVRDVIAAVNPLAFVQSDNGSTTEERMLADLRRLLVGGALVVLAMIGASLLVTSGEGMRERRPALAVLAAVGTRRATVAWSLLWQAAIPVAAGLALAMTLGLALGAMLTAVVGVPLQYDWLGIGLMLAAGAAVIGAVTGLTLPALGRAMRPQALRVE